MSTATEGQVELQLRVNENKDSMTESEDFSDWSGENVVQWIVNLQDGRYRKYEEQLRQSFGEQAISGRSLLDADQIHWNIANIQDKVDLINEIKKLTSGHVLKLGEDIWSLAYVIAKNRKQLPCSYCLLLSLIFMIQVGSLWVMIFDYVMMVNHDTRVQYEMCTADNYQYTTNYSYYYNSSHLNDTSCERVVLIEDNPRTQTHVDRVFRNSINLWVFGITSLTSFCLLSIYIAKSLSNPIIMMIIAHKSIKFKDANANCTRVAIDRLCPSISCHSLSGLLYGMAWSNILLSMVAFLFGMVISFTYPFYFGYSSPIDVIFTPISIVFILELDDWTFEFVKHFYAESAMNELWSYHESQAQKLYSWFRNSLILQIYIIGVPVMLMSWQETWNMVVEDRENIAGVPDDFVYDTYYTSLVCFQLLVAFAYGMPLVYKCFTCCKCISQQKIVYLKEDQDVTTSNCNTLCCCVVFVVLVLLLVTCFFYFSVTFYSYDKY